MAVINNTKSNTLLSGTSGNDSIQNGGYWYKNGVFTGHYGGSNVTINSGEGKDSVRNYYSASVTINTSAGNDYVGNYHSSDVTINTGAGNDEVDNNGSSVTINTGAGNDSVKNYGSSVTITGGKGNDSIYNKCYRQSDGSIYYGDGDSDNNVLFKYTSGDGDDIVYGFDKTSSLSISGSRYSTEKSGNNIIVTVGDGKISLIGAASLSAVNIVRDSTSTTPAISTTLTVNNSTKSPVTVDSAIKTIDASKRTTAVKITGNAQANTISGGTKNDTLYGGNGNDSIVGNAGNDKLYGDAGNDTLFGGAGNDSLWGGNGNDVFIYSAGNDVIADYATGDIISLGGSISRACW